MIAILVTPSSVILGMAVKTWGGFGMVLPPEYAWVELVIIAAIVVFVSDLIGNIIHFQSRVLNAFTTAIVFAVAFSLSIYLRYGTVLIMKWGFAMMRPAP
jgi:hypothetical protein